MGDSLRVQHLRVERLRNIERADLDLAEGQNLLVGGNGQGKTTLLEALYLLGAIRSFRGGRPVDLIQHNAEDALVRGTLGARPPASEVVVALTRQGRQVRVDGKRAELVVHFHRFPIVAFHPGDLELVFGGPAVRRRFLDRMLFQAEAGYAQWHREYRRALNSRNELLKNGGGDREVRAYDSVLAPVGAKMGEARVRMSLLLSDAAVAVLERLGVAPFSFKLRTKVPPEPEKLTEALARALGSDRRRGRTSVGPHTDDLEISRPTGPARVIASRGEARAVAVALRLGERQVICSTAAATPLLLLDDVWAELDRDRAERVLSMVANEPGQVVVTGTGVNEPGAVTGWRRFEIVDGRIISADGE